MAGITLEVAQAKLDLYLAAEEAVLTGQEYEINGRKLKRADLQSIQEGIKVWDSRVKELAAKQAGGRRVAIPRPGF